MAVDAVLGWPGALFARIGHPVSWLGGLIGALDARWNRACHTPAKRRIVPGKKLFAGVSDAQFHRASSAPTRPPTTHGMADAREQRARPTEHGIDRHRHQHRSRKSSSCPLSEVRAPLPDPPFTNFGKSWALANLDSGAAFRSEIPEPDLATSRSGTSDRRHPPASRLLTREKAAPLQALFRDLAFASAAIDD